MGLNLLLVEPDRAAAAALAHDLTALGHTVAVLHDAHDAVTAIAEHAFDAAILERALHALDGVAVLQRLRDEGVTMPIVLLTALARPAEKAEGLDAGADDYIVKPADPAELVARLRALLRGRRWGAATIPNDTLSAGGIVVSPTKYRAWRNGISIDLHRTELRLLAELVRGAGNVVSRATLTERVWNEAAAPSPNLLDVHIRRLRAKLALPGLEDPIVTLRGLGYRLRD